MAKQKAHHKPLHALFTSLAFFWGSFRLAMAFVYLMGAITGIGACLLIRNELWAFLGYFQSGSP